jgi:hypothetical protein
MKRSNIYLPMAALILAAALAAPAAAQKPVRMTFSGSSLPTAINVQPNTITDEELLAGKGTLGPFTLRKLRTDLLPPQPSDTCSGPTLLNVPVVAGAGVFRFQDGSLLTAQITEGAICVDLTTLVGHLTETYQITGGTGRFEGASGNLTLTATLRVVFSDASGNPALLTSTGEFAGTVLGVDKGEEGQDEGQ